MGHPEARQLSKDQHEVKHRHPALAGLLETQPEKGWRGSVRGRGLEGPQEAVGWARAGSGRSVRTHPCVHSSEEQLAADHGL